MQLKLDASNYNSRKGAFETTDQVFVALQMILITRGKRDATRRRLVQSCELIIRLIYIEERFHRVFVMCLVLANGHAFLQAKLDWA